jgi:hypothetical protein
MASKYSQYYVCKRGHLHLSPTWRVVSARFINIKGEIRLGCKPCPECRFDEGYIPKD